MATWVTLNGDDLPIIPELESLFSQAKPAVEALALAADGAKTALNILSAITLNVPPDPNALIKQAINNLILDIINTGVSCLLVKPTFSTGNNYRGLDGFGRVLKDSLYDYGDLQRPAFNVGDTSGGVIFTIHAPSFAELAPLAENFQKLFGEGWNELIDYVKNLPGRATPHVRVESTGIVESIPLGADRRKTFIDQTQVAGGITKNGLDPYKGQRVVAVSGRNVGLSARIESYDSATGRFELNPGFRFDLEAGDLYLISFNTDPRPPDWYTVRAVDVVPPISLATEALARVRDSIPSSSASDALAELIALMDRKVALFDQIVALIDEILTNLSNLGDVTNINMLPIPPQGFGNDGFLNEYWNADNAPDIANNDVTMGLVVYGGSGVYDVLKKLFPI